LSDKTNQTAGMDRKICPGQAEVSPEADPKLLPKSDLIMRHFLASRLNPEAKIDLIDLDERILDHYVAQLGINPAQVRLMAGRECIPAYVDRLVRGE